MSYGGFGNVAMQMEWTRDMKFRTATVVAGKKVPIGTTGTVIWAGHGKYGARVGIKTAAGEVHFTAAKNVKVGEKVPYTPKGKPAFPATNVQTFAAEAKHQCEDEGCAYAHTCVGWEAYGPPAFKSKDSELAEAGF